MPHQPTHAAAPAHRRQWWPYLLFSGIVLLVLVLVLLVVALSC
ncbi:hypothetical protein [Micromonospora endolithica]|nr:hypothetical protein [Micromonospora endolithica]